MEIITLYSILGFLLAGAAGTAFAIRGCPRAGSAGVAVGMIGLAFLALPEKRLPAIYFPVAKVVAAEPLMVNHAQLTVHNEPSTLTYFASTLDRAKKVYHRPGCQYDRLTAHRVWFADSETAEAAGYEPCSKCLLSGTVATRGPQPSQHPIGRPQ